jgi:hypothetical protein
MLKTLSLPSFINILAPSKPLAKRNFARSARVHAKPISIFRLWAFLVLAALNFAALMWYVAGVNNNASKGYEIKHLQSQISLLEEQGQQLNLKVSEAGSMVEIQTDFLKSNFVAAGPAIYLQMHPVAMK